MHNDTGASPVTIARQVDREGERWGLVSEIMRDGTVKACQTVKKTYARGGVGAVVDETTTLCTVDEDAPFSAVLLGRVRAGELSITERYKKADALRNVAAEKAYEELKSQVSRDWTTRKRITMLPGGIVQPEGLANRAAYRQRLWR